MTVPNYDMNVILTCSSLKDHIDAAQAAMGTSWPVVVVDRSHHVEPAEMKQVVSEAIARIMQEYSGSKSVRSGQRSTESNAGRQGADNKAGPQGAGNSAEPLTVLVSMGFCGGTWDHVSFPCRVVIPRADDCISIMLTSDDKLIPNRKEIGHLYLYEKDPADFSALKMLRDGGTAEESYRNMSREDLFRYWFGNYHAMDIIDTGLNPCYEESYVEAAQKEADAINAQLGYAQGSNHLLEKLVSGRWDEQFIVAEPGKLIKHSDFFD